MCAPNYLVCFSALLMCGLVSLVAAEITHPELIGKYGVDGYLADDGYKEEAVDVAELEALCPSPLLLRLRTRCALPGGGDAECVREQCCPSHRFVAGRCLPAAVEPCSLQLCEQRCSVRGAEVWCSCLPGYAFSAERFLNQTQPYCVDIDECLQDQGGCSERCVNEPGRHRCECSPPAALAPDKRSCLPPSETAMPVPLRLIGNKISQSTTRCSDSCREVWQLSRKVQIMAKQLSSLQSQLEDNQDATSNKVLDGMVQLEGGYCRCERGPRGPAGPAGVEGPRGPQGMPGSRGSRGKSCSLDLMLLLVADIRHDLQNLEARVYGDSKRPERFNIQKAWRRQRKQNRLDKEKESEVELEAFLPPADVLTDAEVEVTTNGASGEVERETGAPGVPEMDDNLRLFYLLANSTSPGDDDTADLYEDYDLD